MGSEVEMRSSSSQRQASQRLNDLHDEEESSLLSDRGNNGNGPASSPLDRIASPRRSSSLSKDFQICNTAWSRLSCPTRSALLLVVGLVLIFGAYELGMDEGLREQERDNAKHSEVGGSWKSWRLFGGKGGGVDDNEVDGKNPASKSVNEVKVVERERDEPPKESNSEGSGGGEGGADSGFRRIFRKENLINTRARARELISTLHEYYGGEERARAMLVDSWQAKWALGEGSAFSYEDGDDDDVDDDAADDVDDEDRRHAGEKNDAGRRTKKKGVKEGNIIEDVDAMSPEELGAHRRRRRQRTAKLVATMARAVLDPFRDRFIIGTIGSSVAAGHDNCHYDSYESQLERTLAPILASANAMVMVQNAGEGGGCGDTHENQVFCVTHNVSPDVDIVHYSWTYFEKDGAEVQREQLVRWAQQMERRPMVHHMVARGKKNTCEGDNAANVELDKHYAEFGYNAFCIQTGLYFGGHDYDAEIEAGINRFGWKFQGDGYHNTTRYGEELPDDNARKSSLGTVYRNWHPGPLGFQIASDAFAYVYVTGLLMALDIIEEDMNAGVDLLDRWFDRDGRQLGSAEEEDEKSQALRRTASSMSEPSTHRQLRIPSVNLPKPLFCEPLYCSTPHPPNCLNYEKPTFGNPGIAVQNQAGWKIFNDANKWNYKVGKVDIALIKEMRSAEWERKCAHLDACGGIFASDSRDGTLAFELPTAKMTAGLVFVCLCCGNQPGGKGIAEYRLLENQNVTIKLNGNVLDKAGMDKWPTGKCVRLLRQFGAGGYKKEDTMVLTFEMADQDPDLAYELKPHFEISHVVAL